MIADEIFDKMETPILSAQSIERVLRKYHQDEVASGKWRPMAEHLLFFFRRMQDNDRRELRAAYDALEKAEIEASYFSLAEGIEHLLMLKERQSDNANPA